MPTFHAEYAQLKVDQHTVDDNDSVSSDELVPADHASRDGRSDACHSLLRHQWLAAVALCALVGVIVFLQFFRIVPRDQPQLPPHSAVTDYFPAVAPLVGPMQLQQQQHQEPTEREQEAVHIALCGDKEYYVGILAVINTTTLNCRTPSTLRFHLVTTDDESAQFLQRIVHELFPTVLVHTVVLNAETGHALPTGAVWAKYRSQSLSKPLVYARYFFPDVFPSLHRLIYLDQDVIVVDDIRKLWEVEMSGFPVAAARLNRPGTDFRGQFNMKDKALRHFSKKESSFNNGVLMYDLDAWRVPGVNYTDELLSWTALNKKRRLYSLGSQPPFNLVFYNNLKVLDTKWNVMDLAGLNRAKTKEPITVPYTEVMEAGILHWNGVLKPWDCDGFYSEIWRQYLPQYKLYLPNNSTESEECGRHQVWTDNMRMRSGVEKFTVVLTSFMRVDNLLKIVQHLRKSDYVEEIVLVWNNQNASCPESISSLVRCFQQPDNYVHNRFRPWNEIRTDAVLQHDDDIIVPLVDLENAFKIWTRNRERMVGFEPRVINCADEHDSSTCSYNFQITQGYFDLVIGKLFFVRNSYMRDFLSYPGMVDLTSHAPCEDLAMNFYVGHTVHQAPLLYTADITEIKSKHFAGLSQGIDTTDWRLLRHSCIRLLHDLFGGRMVLPQTRMFHPDSASFFVLRSTIGTGSFSWCSDLHGSRPCKQP